MKYPYSPDYFKKYGNLRKDYSSQKNNPTFKKVADEIVSLRHSGKILDIGCAGGYFLLECKKRGYDVYGVDISNFIVKKAKSLLRQNNKIFKVDLSAEKLPYKSNYFDVVSLLDSLEHIENPQNALREARRVMRKSGLLYIRLPGFTRGLSEPSHVNFYTPVSLKVLLERHKFNIIKLGEEGGRFQIPFGLIRLILKGNTYFNYVPKGTGSFISCYAKKT